MTFAGVGASHGTDSLAKPTGRSAELHYADAQ
jgi:hypothetical protein